jgi:hypothetical protein
MNNSEAEITKILVSQDLSDNKIGLKVTAFFPAA